MLEKLTKKDHQKLSKEFLQELRGGTGDDHSVCDAMCKARCGSGGN